MDDKVLGSIGDVELAHHVGGAILNSDVGGNMTRDEGEMAFYGKKAQLKVRVLKRSSRSNTSRLMKSSGDLGFYLSPDIFAVFWQLGNSCLRKF